MKNVRFYFMSLVAMFVLFSCEKDDDQPSLASQIEGEWEITQMQLDGRISWEGLEIEFTADDALTGTIDLEGFDGEFRFIQKSNDYELEIEFDEEIPFRFTSDGTEYMHGCDEFVFKSVVITDGEIELEDGEDQDGYEWEWELER